MKHTTKLTIEEDKGPRDDVDELLETDTEENQSSDTEEINIEEPRTEPEQDVPIHEAKNDQDDLSSDIRELKPTIMELRQVRVELQNASLETISRLKRKCKNKNRSDDAKEISTEKEQHGSGPTRRNNVVKCGQCQTMMPRSKLRSHKAEKHGKDQGRARDVEDEGENIVPGEVSKKVTEKEVECHLCDDKFKLSEINGHLKTIHNTDVDYEAIMEQFNSMESAPDMRSPKRFKRETSPEPQSSTAAETLLELEYVPEEAPVRKELEKTPRVQIAKVQKVYKKCETCLKSVEASSMEEHNVLYHVGTDFKCGLCYQIFSEKERLRAHIGQQHRHEKDLLNNRLEPDFSVSECKVACTECPLRFITASSCDLHKSVEHAKRGVRRSCDK